MPTPAALPARSPETSRRSWLRSGALASASAWVGGCAVFRRHSLRLATFAAEVTVPLGHGMMGGAWKSKVIVDPLEAHGVILLGAGDPVVFVSVDWCEIRNEAYARWQTLLAEAVGTSPARVLVSTIHQHDAPVADPGAERFLRERGLEGSVCDPDFVEATARHVAARARAALRSSRRLTRIGHGQAKVEKVACNRRYVMPDGQVRFDRTSATRNAFALEAEEGLIDPWLRTLSFWNEDEPLAALSFYAVHPMSYYGQGEVSADFPGIARRTRQQESPRIHQIYVSGASGNVTAGKYNQGLRETRPSLAERIHAAMAEAWRTTQRFPAARLDCRSVPLRLEPRSGAGFSEDELLAKLVPATAPFQQCLAAMGLSWRQRLATRRPLEIPCMDFGAAALLLVPGETYVDFQLAAQAMRNSDFICVAGYGDGATGYVPTEQHRAENDTNLGDWCWVAPGSEERLLAAMRRALVDSRA